MTTEINLIQDRSGPGISFGPSREGSVKYATGDKTSERNVTKVETVIGTWIVRSLSQCGKAELLVHEMDNLNWHILGISEMRWEGTGEALSEDGHKLWFSGNNKKKINGVGFLVNMAIKNSVLEYTPVNERLAMIRIAGKPFNLTVVQVYAPTQDCCDEVIDDFYENLNDLIKTIRRKDILVVQGDWNAKIGEDAYENWKGVVGKFGHGETNERGLKLLEFAKNHQLIVANTLFNHKISRRTTWHSPDGKTHNQIDFILISKRFSSGINRAKTRTFSKPDIGSDHDLVMMPLKIKLKISKKTTTDRTRFDLEKLKDPTIAEQYQGELAGRFAPLLLLDQDPQTLCDKITNTIKNVAEEKLGKCRKIKRPWLTSEVLEKCEDRRNKKKRKCLGAVERAECRTANRECTK